METENKSLSLDIMRAKRNTAESLFMKFVSYEASFKTHAFCFYEGEDAKYYDIRVRKYWGDNVVSLIAGNKKEVLKIMKKIQLDPLYSKVTVMFFVDHDFDAHVTPSNPDLFETPCYSIENFYAQEIVFSRILKAEFNLNMGDADYEKCMTDFRARFGEFNNIMLIFNALIKYQRQYEPNAQCQFNNIHTSSLVKCSIDKVLRLPKCDQVEQQLKENINPDSTILQQIQDCLASDPNISFTLRGKNQLDFFVAILQNLKQLSTTQSYFSQKLSLVYLNITKNRLSELSQYAITPPELEAFLRSHIKKVI